MEAVRDLQVIQAKLKTKSDEVHIKKEAKQELRKSTEAMAAKSRDVVNIIKHIPDPDNHLNIDYHTMEAQGVEDLVVFLQRGGLASMGNELTYSIKKLETIRQEKFAMEKMTTVTTKSMTMQYRQAIGI